MKLVLKYIPCIVFIACIPFISFSQVKDDFSDGNFTENPLWTGDMTHFEVNLAGQLHLISAGSDTSVLMTSSLRLEKTEWSFWLKLSFNSSVNNHARVYLASDTMEINQPLNGYYLQVGGADDSLLIIKQTGSILKTVYRFKSCKISHSTNTLRLRIRRYEDGLWETMIDTTGGFNYLKDGVFTDNSVFGCRWFGVMCRYTASNALKFYFDEFYVGPVLYDTVSPKVVSAETATPAVLRTVFSEPVNREDAAFKGNYLLLSQANRVDSVELDAGQPAVALLHLHHPMPDGTADSLQIRNITDLSGNLMADTVILVYCYQPRAYDVLIHEIMADPDPVSGPPNSEFIELYNRSAFPISLKGWSFRFGSYSRAFPDTRIEPGGYLLIGRDQGLLSYGRCAFLFTSASSLPNEGATLVLYDNFRHVIHAVTYSDTWHLGAFKKEGGWSLEMADPGNPCGCGDNWGSSQDPSGGTPGRNNSIRATLPDQTNPFALRGTIIDTTMSEIFFSEAMDSASLVDPGSWIYRQAGDLIHPLAVYAVSPGFSSARIMVDQAFKQGMIYQVSLSKVMQDCAGNHCDTAQIIRIAYPVPVGPHDVVINEILPNPASGGSCFVELYNRSEKIIDLRSLLLASGDTAGGVLTNGIPLVSDRFLFFPGDHVAFTPGQKDILDRYHTQNPWNIISMSSFPSLQDDSGVVVIARKDNLSIIDKVSYHHTMHYPLLISEDGVSLERFDPNLPSDDEGNWHSASETAGFATPGYLNSQRVHGVTADGMISLQPDVFSPDNDGQDDILVIALKPETPGCAADLAVFDARGRLIRQLASNILAGSENIFTWDGITTAGTKAPIGIYLLMARFTDPGGRVKTVRTTTVLAGKLSSR